MKKLFLLALTVILFTACENKQQRYFDESPEIEILKAGIDAYEAQDWVTWKANFADTAKVYHNTKIGIAPNEQLESMRAMLSNFSSYGFSDEGEFSEMVLDKDNETWVNYWGNWTGKLSANNKELQIPVHLTAQFINGKIVQEYAYYDTAPIILAMQEIAANKVAEETAQTE